LSVVVACLFLLVELHTVRAALESAGQGSNLDLNGVPVAIRTIEISPVGGILAAALA
jgi:hypothetical protein